MIALVVDHHRHALALEVERDLVHLAGAALHVEIGVGEDGAVEQIAQAGLVVRIHVSVAKDVVRLAIGHVDVALEDDPILRQGARLVGAEHVHRAEVLDGVEALDDDLLLAHRHRALGEIDGDDHRQHLGREPDRHREAEEQGLGPVVLGEADDEEDGGDHDGHEADHQPGKALDAAVEAGEHAPAGELGGEGTEVGARAGIHHHAAGGAAHYVRALEAG